MGAGCTSPLGPRPSRFPKELYPLKQSASCCGGAGENGRKGFPVRNALIAAAVAAVVAAASSTAATIVVTSKNIKNGTIQTIDLSAGAKRALKGQRGPAGPPGATGVAGPAGGFDPAKVTYVEGASIQVAPGATGSGRAYCPTGAKALSGGWVVISGDVGEVFGNRSYDSGGSWSVLVFNHATYTNATVTPFAVCASA